MIDLACSLFLLLLVVAALGAYVLRAVLFGRAQNRRIEGAGSPLLGRTMMEMTYWVIEPLARVLMRLRVTPNMITAASLVPAVLSGVAIAMGHMGVGALMGTLAGFCDLMDGVLARKSGASSDAGEVFDAAVDRYVEFFLLAGLVVRCRDEVVLQVLALGALLACFMVSYATAKAEALRVEPPRGAMRRAVRGVYLLFGALFVPITAALLGDPSQSIYVRDLPILLAMTIVAVVGNVSAVRRLRGTARLLRERDLHERTRMSEPQQIARA